VVDTFTGSGETRTDTPLFNIVGPRWRVVYESVNTAPPSIGRGGVLGFFIRNERGDALDPNPVEVRGDNCGIKNLYSDPGQYYIQVISAEVDWTLRVEDCGNLNEDPTNPPIRPIEQPRERVVPETVVSNPLAPTGGPAILAPAVVLLLSAATVVLLVTRRQ
jgi:hypothetical protein